MLNRRGFPHNVAERGKVARSSDERSATRCGIALFCQSVSEQQLCQSCGSPVTG